MDDVSAPLSGEQKLFAELGHEILTKSRMGTGVSERQKAELGRDWFKGHLTNIRQAICGNATIEDLATKGDTTALIAVTAPLLGFSPTAAAATTIAVLVSRIGLRRICDGEWD